MVDFVAGIAVGLVLAVVSPKLYSIVKAKVTEWRTKL